MSLYACCGVKRAVIGRRRDGGNVARVWDGLDTIRCDNCRAGCSEHRCCHVGGGDERWSAVEARNGGGRQYEGVIAETREELRSGDGQKERSGLLLVGW